MGIFNKKKKSAIIMVGIPGSGKSTEALALQKAYILEGFGETRIVSSDDIRAEILNDVNDQIQNDLVFKEVHKRIKQAVKDGVNVIIDATNIKIKSRTSILNCIKDKSYTKIAYVIPTAKEICIKRNNSRDRVVPEWVIEKQIKQFEIPFYNEGFDEIYIMGWSDYNVARKIFDPVTNPIMKKMEGFDQKNSHHKHTLDKHCKECAKELSKVTSNKMLIRAGYVHDIGKVFTQELKPDNSGECRYYSHHNVGTYYLLQNLDWLCLNNMNEVLECLFYVNYHMQPFFINGEKTENKWKEIFGEDKYNNLVIFNKCDIIASGRE